MTIQEDPAMLDMKVFFLFYSRYLWQLHDKYIEQTRIQSYSKTVHFPNFVFQTNRVF